jgi:hypothetical protein
MRYSSSDIALSEGPVNLNWGPIMKTINESPFDFFQQGGWSFLGGPGADDVRPSSYACVLVLILSVSRAMARSHRLLNPNLKPLLGKAKRTNPVTMKANMTGAMQATMMEAILVTMMRATVCDLFSSVG